MRRRLMVSVGGAALLTLLAVLAQPSCRGRSPAPDPPPQALEAPTPPVQPNGPIRPTDPCQFAEHLQEPGLMNLGRISPSLYRGAQPSEEGLKHLRDLGVRTVVSLRNDHWKDEEKACHKMGLGFVHIPLEPSESPADEDVRRFLKVATDPASQPVFFHCAQGQDRTGAFCSCYRMAVNGWPLEKAVGEMKDFGFHDTWRDLKEYVTSFPSRRASVWSEPVPAGKP